MNPWEEDEVVEGLSPWELDDEVAVEPVKLAEPAIDQTRLARQPTIGEFAEQNIYKGTLDQQKEAWDSGDQDKEIDSNLGRVGERLALTTAKETMGLAELMANQDPRLEMPPPEVRPYNPMIDQYPSLEQVQATRDPTDVLNYVSSLSSKGIFDIAEMFHPDAREDVRNASAIVGKEANRILGKKELQYTGNAAQKIGWEIGEVSLKMGPALLVGWATKNPGMTFGIMGGQVAGNTYSDYMEKTNDHEKSMAAAKFHTVAELAPESIPVMAILRKTKAGEGLRRMLEATFGEAFQESFTSVLTQTYDNTELKDMSFVDAVRGINWSEVGHSAIVGFGAGGVLAAPGATADYIAGKRDPERGSPLRIDPAVRSVEENANVISKALDALSPAKAQYQVGGTPTIEVAPVAPTSLSPFEAAPQVPEAELGQPVIQPEITPVVTAEPQPAIEAMEKDDVVMLDEILAEPSQPVTDELPAETRKLNSKGNHWKTEKNAKLFVNNKKLGNKWVPVQEDEGWALHHESTIDKELDATVKEDLAVKPDMPTGEEIAADTLETLATHEENDLKAPTEAQIEADNYKKTPVNYDGLDIKIETAAGQKRKPEWPALKHHYGDIKRTESADGDAVDVFINKDNERTDTPVFIINQTDKAGKWDEHKILLGFESEAEARQGYLDNYDKDWKAPDVIPQLTMDEFKSWLKSGDTTKPYIEPAPQTATDRQAEIDAVLSTEEDIAATTIADRRYQQSVAQTARQKANLQPDSKNDDLSTFIRKSGGIDTDKYGDMRGRLSQLDQNNKMFGLSKIEQPGKGLDQDTLKELLTSNGYLQPGQELEDLLFDMEGKDLYSIENEKWMEAEDEAYNEAYEEEHGTLESQYEQDTDYDPTLSDYTPDKPNLMAELVAEANQIVEQQLKNGNQANEYALEAILSESVTDAQALDNLIKFIVENTDGKQITTRPEGEAETGPAEEGKRDEAKQPEKEAEPADKEEGKATVTPITKFSKKESESKESQDFPRKPWNEFDRTYIEEFSQAELGNDADLENITGKEYTDIIDSLNNEYEKIVRYGYDIDEIEIVDTKRLPEGLREPMESINKIINEARKRDNSLAKVQPYLFTKESKTDQEKPKEKPLEVKKQAKAPPAKAETAKEISGKLESSKQFEADEFESLEDVYLDADTGTEIISDTAANWLQSIDDRLEAVNKLRGCL